MRRRPVVKRRRVDKDKDMHTAVSFSSVNDMSEHISASSASSVAHLAAVGQHQPQPQRPEPDSISAIRMLRARFPLASIRSPPLVLAHMLYTVIRDRSDVDVHVENVRLSNEFRVFQMQALGSQQKAIVLTDDLAIHAHGIAPQGSTRREILDLFVDRVYPHCLKTFIETSALKRLLRGDVAQPRSSSSVSPTKVARTSSSRSPPRTSDQSSLFPVDVEEGISVLVQEGFLIRRDNSSYYFAIPNVGHFVQHLRQGRKAMLSFLRQRQYQECPYDTLVKIRIRSSDLSSEFIVRDLIGSGQLQRLEKVVRFLPS